MTRQIEREGKLCFQTLATQWKKKENFPARWLLQMNPSYFCKRFNFRQTLKPRVESDAIVLLDVNSPFCQHGKSSGSSSLLVMSMT